MNDTREMRPPLRFVDAEDALHDAAARQAGWSDFGPVESYRPALRQLLASLDEEAPLTAAGRSKMFDRLVAILVGRAHSQRGWDEHPESLQYDIRRPILITGLPRTGTTALHRLLAMDPQFQGLEYWLIGNPQPRPPRERWAQTPAYQATVAELDALYAEVPEMRKAHEILPDEVYECLMLTRQSFVAIDFTTIAHVPSYQRWFLEQDQTASYLRYRDNLRLIGNGERDKPWLLKNPAALFGLDGFLRAFPDALIVQTHRNPVASVASGCSLSRMARVPFEGEDTDARLCAQREMDIWSAGIRQTLQVRDSSPQRFLDVYFSDFATRPMDVVRDIYQRSGLVLSAEAEALMQRWIVENPQHKHGEHRYSLDGLGVTEQQIRESFAPYIERYGL